MPKQAMAFCHNDGLVPTWQMAQKYIGKGGRIATLPDIFDARLATEPGAFPWETYFTTLSAEYIGMSRGGNKIIIVAHGVGPMATLDGIVAAYKFEFNDKSRHNRGGRISQKEFRKLENGDYGDVFVVDFNSYVARYRYPFIECLRRSRAFDDLLLHARLGGEERAHDYVLHHARHAEAWHEQQLTFDPANRHGMSSPHWGDYVVRRRLEHLLDRSNPFVIKVGDASNCWYMRYPIEEGLAVAHLLTSSALVNLHHEGHESLASDIHSHEWTNGCRFVAVPDGADLVPIHPGWNSWRMIEEHWESLMVPLPRRARTGIRPLMKLGDTWFTQYPARGHSMATWEAEFQVTEVEPIGKPVEFRTEIHGYYGLFRYDVQDVKAIAPPNANAFLVTDPEPVWQDGNPTHHKATVQFYLIKADTSRRLRRQQDLEGDFETQMRLLSQTA